MKNECKLSEITKNWTHENITWKLQKQSLKDWEENGLEETYWKLLMLAKDEEY